MRIPKLRSGLTTFLAVLLFSLLISPLTQVAAAKEKLAEMTTSKPRWTGDFNELISHRIIRALVPYSKTFYFLDRGRPMGLEYDTLKKFEKFINTKLKTRHLAVHVMVIPTQRDKLIPNLIAGHGDIAAGNLTITDLRQKHADFSDPFLTGVTEILVTGPDSPEINTIDDLPGQKIHVRKSSSYHESLIRLNQRLRKQGARQVGIFLVDENLEDEDLLEMVNAGMVPMVIADNHKAKFWAQIFKKIKLHPDIIVREGGQTAWAVRKNSPQLLGMVNSFVKDHKKGSLLGNIMFEKYLENTEYVRAGKAGGDNFKKVTAILKKYAGQYHFDWLLLKALAFQESGINQSKKSPRGAVGVMQILPSTARDPNVDIPDIHRLDSNIHAGTKYLRFLMDHYFSDDEIRLLDQQLLALAAYNAGPRQISRLRARAGKQGLDPNVWFRNVEVMAAKQIGRETVQYVSNIFKYYVSYKLIEEKGRKL